MRQRPPIFALLFLAAFASCSRHGGAARQLEPITVGVPPLEQNALLYVAEHEGFFSDQGLKVEIRTRPDAAVVLYSKA